MNPDGSFVIKNVAPGEYRLSVRGPGDKDHPAEGVTMTLSVTGEDLTGVVLAGGSGGSIAGRVVSDTGEVVPSPASSRMRVFARPVDPTSTYTSFDNDNGRVKDDWSFELTNVYGMNRLSINPMPTGWAVRRIEHDGRDYADVPVDLHGGQKLDGVSIVLPSRCPDHRTLLDERASAEGTALIFRKTRPDGERTRAWCDDASRRRGDVELGSHFGDYLPWRSTTCATGLADRSSSVVARFGKRVQG